eukprot:3833776-Prymnesium_polylepis.1
MTASRPLWALSKNPKLLEWPIIRHPRASRTHHARELSRQQRFGQCSDRTAINAPRGARGSTRCTTRR